MGFWPAIFHWIKTVTDLKKAARAGKIQKIKGLGKTVEDNILRGIAFTKKSKGRMLLGMAIPVAEELLEEIKKSKLAKKCELAGSIRRRRETIGDIDILATAKKPSKLIDFFTTLPQVARVMAKGPTKATVRLKEGIQVDLRVLKNSSWGSGQQYFIGSKQHNIETRKIAIKKGYKLSEYGLFKGKRQVAGVSEVELYRKLGLQWIPPEMRENTGEIELARRKQIPRLINIQDIQGDLHCHTNASDGAHSILDMAKAGKKFGLKYLNISDHAGFLKIAGAMNDAELLKHIREIEKANKKIKGITLLKGAEIDIKEDGSMPLKNSTLKKLDVVIASIHHGFKNPKAKMTKRMITAMNNPYVHILGHPSGRLLKKREPYDFDFEKICEAAKKTGTALEIDAQPARLDLKPEYIRKAIEYKCKLVIDSDAHAENQIPFIKLGVFTARRGWAQKKHILNTLPLAKFKKAIK